MCVCVCVRAHARAYEYVCVLCSAPIIYVQHDAILNIDAVMALALALAKILAETYDAVA